MFEKQWHPYILCTWSRCHLLPGRSLEVYSLERIKCTLFIWVILGTIEQTRPMTKKKKGLSDGIHSIKRCSAPTYPLPLPQEH